MTMRTLYTQQRTAVDFMLRSLRTHRATLNSSETGTGKTLMSVVAARELAPPAVLVVCPKSVILPWQETLREQGVPAEVINYEKLRMGTTPFVKKSGKSGKSGKMFRWALPPDSLIIWDESHRLKSWDSQNSAMATAATTQGMLSMFASATPFRDPTEMKAHGYAFGMFKLHEYLGFCQAHGCEKGLWGGQEFVLDEESAPVIRRMGQWLYGNVAVRLTRADMGEHFAQCSISWEPREFRDQAAIRKAFAEIGDALELLEVRKSMDGLKPAVVTKILRARQKVELLKLDTIAEMAQDGIEQGMSVFVALCFRDSVAALQQMMKMPSVVIEGGQTPKVRNAALAAFQNGSVKLLVANIEAGGVGINLHDELGDCPRLALISPSFDEKQLQQVLGRVDRAGAKTPSVQRLMIAAGTIEETIFNALKEKLALSDLTHAKTGTESPTPMSTTTAAPQTEQSAVLPERPAHAEFGPSALKNYVACAGYLPSSGDSEASRSGTRVHLALETDNDTGLTSEDELMKAEYCRNAVVLILKREGFLMEEGALDVDIQEFREIVLDVWATGDETYGTCDRAFIRGDKAVVIDYKNGNWGVEEPIQNWQAKAYTLGIFQKFPEVRTVEFYFTMPARDEILHGTFTRDMVLELMDQIGYYIRRARLTRRAAAKGEFIIENFNVDLNKQCLFCARVTEKGAGCPKINGVAFEAIRRYTTDVELPPNLDMTALAASTTFAPEQMRDLLRLGAILEKMAAAWKSLAKEMIMEEGIIIPGYEIKERQGPREITDIRKSLEVAAQYGVTKDAYIEALAKVSVAQWETLIKDHAKSGSKTKMVEAALADLYEAGALAQKEPTYILTASRK